jgi:hypothetical protein
VRAVCDQQSRGLAADIRDVCTGFSGSVSGRSPRAPRVPVSTAGVPCYDLIVGTTALYRDLVPYRPERAHVQLDVDTLILAMPNSSYRRHPLDGVHVTIGDGFVAERSARGSEPAISIMARHGAPITPRVLRRFVRMLVLERPRDGESGGPAWPERSAERIVVITPPDQGAVAPNVVFLPEAPADAAIVDDRAWDALADWLLGGGRLAACSIADLARLACIATPQFAVLIGEVAAQRALEQVWAASGPLRGGQDLDSALQPLVDAAKHSPRASEALTSALAHAAGASRRRRWR